MGDDGLGHGLRKAFKSLPEPKNDFELQVPEDEEGSTIAGDEEWVEDEGELSEQRAARIAQQKEEEKKRRTQVFRRELPIPKKLNELYKKRSTAKSAMSRVRNSIIKICMGNL